jgi:hypothetical protein
MGITPVGASVRSFHARSPQIEARSSRPFRSEVCFRSALRIPRCFIDSEGSSVADGKSTDDSTTGRSTYLTTSRGHRRQSIFEDDRDREHFLELLAETTLHYRWVTDAFALMTTSLLSAAHHAAARHFEVLNSRDVGLKLRWPALRNMRRKFATRRNQSHPGVS